MDHTGFLTGNLTLDLAILAWFAAHVLKTLLHWVTNRNLDLRKMIGSGNMPSSHSAFICAASASIGQVCGWRDPLFSLSAAIALVVMYDACNVRRAAGEQAKVINYVREHWDDLLLICRARQGDVTPYQDAPVGSLLNWSELLELARADAPCAGPVAFCSGTVPVEDGNIRYADAWDIRLEDPVMGRAIEHRYEVIRLEDRN